MGERVAVLQSFWDALDERIALQAAQQVERGYEPDNSFRATFAISAIKPNPNEGGKWKRKRDVYFQWFRLDSEGSKVYDERGYPERWSVNWTLWDGQVEKYGEQLALLFAPASGERDVYISIYIKDEDAKAGAIYAEKGRDEWHPWLKLEPEGYDIWLHRPKWDNMSVTQQEAWETLGKPDWVNIYTCKGGNPFVSQEEGQEQEPQGPVEAAVVPVAVNTSGEAVMTSEDW